MFKGIVKKKNTGEESLTESDYGQWGYKDKINNRIDTNLSLEIYKE